MPKSYFFIMAGVLESIDHPGMEALVQDDLAAMWSLRHYVRGRFPCNNPCSIMRADLPLLREHTYLVSEKNDGIRLYLLMGALPSTERYAFLIDRACRLYPCSLSLRVPVDYFSGTLFDGELVEDADGGYTYIVFDCVASKGLDYKTQHFTTRLSIVQQAAADGVFNFHLPHFQKAPLKYRVKEWLPLTRETRDKLTTLLRSSQKTDGVILVRNDTPLRLGTQADMLKWKPASHHTIDFVFENGALFLRDHTGIVRAPVTLASAAQPIESGSIVECTCSQRADGQWIAEVARVRTDKTEPNSVRVANLTLQNIREAIRFDELFET